jgi:hypothetical protein
MPGGVRTQKRRSWIAPQEIAFIELALQSESPVSRKQALQRLCELYRQGARAAAPRTLKALIIHSLVDSDEKVRRWAFNAMAQLGEAADVPLMIGPWEGGREDVAVFEAGLTALASLMPKPQLLTMLGDVGVELGAGAVMALAQQTNDFSEELNQIRLTLETATTDELRAATLLIGLKKSPETLFSDRFPVADVIGDLNTYDDRIVAQYSFWATVEHPNLGLGNVRVSPNDFSKLPPNVQGWAYRTLTKDGSKAFQHYDVIVAASESKFPEVREGVAIGLRNIFYDSLDITVTDWFVDEMNVAVREALLDHMATHISKSSAYREEILRSYRQAGNGSVLRSRIEAANRDEQVALELRKISLQMNDPDLFASMMGPTMTNTQNFNAPVTAGGISNSGTGSSGTVQIMTLQEAQARALPLLEKLRQNLEGSDVPPSAHAGAELTAEAIAAPTKSRVQRLLGWLKTANEGGEAFKGIAHFAVEAYDKLGDLVEHLPDAI